MRAAALRFRSAIYSILSKIEKNEVIELGFASKTIPVTASEAKQSRVVSPIPVDEALECFVAALLAMTDGVVALESGELQEPVDHGVDLLRRDHLDEMSGADHLADAPVGAERR